MHIWPPSLTSSLPLTPNSTCTSFSLPLSPISFSHLRQIVSVLRLNSSLRILIPFHVIRTLRSIYFCTALRVLDKALWKRTTCGSAEYITFLDNKSPVRAFSNVDSVANSAYYEYLTTLSHSFQFLRCMLHPYNREFHVHALSSPSICFTLFHFSSSCFHRHLLGMIALALRYV